MIRRENPNFVASIYAPNPKEVTYWIDLKEGPDGQVIKSFVNNKWVKVNENKNDEQDANITQLQQKVTALENTMPTKVDNVSVTGNGVAVSTASISGNTLTLTKGYNPTEATTSAAGLMSAADKTKLNGIAANANNYSLPNASASTRGGVLQAAAVEDLAGTEDAAAICTKVNALLAALRTAGILAA